MAEGNRKDPRARVLNMTVRYKSATVDEFIENHSHDISKGGIFIKTRAPFPAGTLLKFEVRIAEDQRLMQGVGRVVWRREPERAEEGFPAGMGIKFIKTGEGAAELIAQVRVISDDHRELNVGEVRQLAVSTDRFTLMVANVAEGYYLLLVLGDSSSYGRARFELRRARLLFEPDLT